MTTGGLRSRRFHFGRAVLSVVLIYGLFAALWILFSDVALKALFSDPEQIIRVSLIKGWLFVALTTLLLYVLVKRQNAELHAAHEAEMRTCRERQRTLELLSAIVENSADAIYAKDDKGRYLLFNRAACRFVGKPVTEVLGQDDTALFPAALAARLMAVDRQVMASGQTETNEVIIDVTGAPRTLLATKGPLHDAGGKTIGIFGISRDVTERQRAEEALRLSELRFRAIVEQTLAGIYIIQDGHFRYVNPAFAAMFGYDSPADLIDSLPIEALIAEADRTLVAENIRRRLEGEIADIHYNFVGLRRDGSTINVEVHGRAFEYEGRPAVIGLIQDISQRIRTETELRQRNEELERFNRASVGRELEMIELKKSVNELSRALGREPPYILTFLESDADRKESPHGD